MAFLGFGKKDSPEDKKEEAKKKKKKETPKKEGVVSGEKKKAQKKSKTKKASKGRVGRSFNPEDVIIKPRITEKSNILAEDQNAYTFNVPKGVNKTEVKKAIQAIYKVTPVKVNILQVPAKRVSRGGVEGVKSGGKKAVVYLKEGDKIEFV